MSSQSSQRNFDVIIIGSGISSLVAACLLAKKGRSVCVLEKYVKPGGYMHNFQRFGFQFDTGAHYSGALFPGQAFRSLLEYLGVYQSDLFIPMEEDGFDVLRFPSREIRFPRGYDRVIDSLSQSFPDSASAIKVFFDQVSATAKLFPTYNFEEELNENALEHALNTSLAQVVLPLVNDKKLQSALFAHCCVHGVSPQDVPFGLHALMLDSFIRGAHAFRKGGDALAQAFVKRIEELGGKVFLNTPVVELETSNGEVSAVKTKKGELFTGDWIISGIHPKACFRLMDPANFKPIFLDRLAKTPESCAIFGLYASCRKPVPFDRLRNYFIFSTEDPKSLQPSDNDQNEVGPLFLSIPEKEESNSENEFIPISILSRGPFEWFKSWANEARFPRPPAYLDLKQSWSEKIITRVDEVYPGFAASVHKHISSTALTNLFYNSSEQGSAYGIYHSIAHTGARALGPRTHVRNLLLTGQSTLFPGLQGAAVSGLRTAGHLLGMKPLIREIRQFKESA